MTETLMTIDDLLLANESSLEVSQYYLSQVTVEEDLYAYLRWLYDNGVTTYLNSALKRNKVRASGIHPSSASKKDVCLLKLYYECTNKVAPGNDAYDQKSQLTWDIGTLLHDMYQAWFKDMYEDQFASEVFLEDKGLHVTSSTDGIFAHANYRFVIELKSIKEGGSFGWAKVQAKPQEDHVRQAHFYMKLANIPFALIFYINKNAGEFKEHAIAFNPALWEEIESQVIRPVISAAYENGPMVPAKAGWHCRWCIYQHGCPEKGRKDSHVDW
jgi:CRISPR/Cas system-associated exonuclease Cas4 (RecB family)